MEKLCWCFFVAGTRIGYIMVVKHGSGTSCQIDIHFSIQTTKFVMKYNLRCFQMSGRLAIAFTKHIITKFNKFYKGK